MNPILMVNAAYMPLGIIDWMRAVCLLVSGRAEVVVFSGVAVRSPSHTIELPSILRLTHMPKFRQRRVRLTRKNLLARDNHTCQYCGVQKSASGLNMDHVRPRSQGGPTRWDNLVASCIPCNDDKGPRTPEQAGMRLLKLPGPPKWTVAQEIRKTVKTVPEAWQNYLPESRRK